MRALNWFIKHKFITGLIVFIILGIVIAGVNGNSNTTTNKAQPVNQEVKATQTPVPVVKTPLDKDKQIIEAAVRKSLVGDYPELKGADSIDYTKQGWTNKEPLIREVAINGSETLGTHGILSVEFSALPSTDPIMDISDYNSAEMSIVDILDSIKTLKLNTPLTQISVSAWGALKDLSCQKVNMGRMAFVQLPESQLSLIQVDQWQDLNGEGMFNKLDSLGIKTDIWAVYKVCH